MMAVEGLTWLQVRPLVSTVTPVGRLPADPENCGVPLLAWLPLTATGIGSGVTVVLPVA